LHLPCQLDPIPELGCGETLGTGDYIGAQTGSIIIPSHIRPIGNLEMVFQVLEERSASRCRGGYRGRPQGETITDKRLKGVFNLSTPSA